MTHENRDSEVVGRKPTPEDIAHAKLIPQDQCPRRYCWWWRTLGFDWQRTIAEGCEFIEDRDNGRIPENWRLPQYPCRRCDPSSPADHYEPREPHLMEDGFNMNDWLPPDDWRRSLPQPRPFYANTARPPTDPPQLPPAT